MKFTCERDVLLKEITIAQDIISSKNAMSILSNVLLEAADNTLQIRATDLKVSFETRIPVEAAAAGSTTVFCDKLLGILRSLPAGEVEFEEKEGGTLVIRPLFKKIDFRLKTIASDKFPEVPTVQDDSFFELGQADFIEMISQTIFAVSDDETRYYMNGVYLETLNGELVIVATDGRRLSLMKKQPGGAAREFSGIIVPPKILNLVKKLAPGEGNLSMAVTEKSLFIRLDNQKISSALIEGQFPNYQRVIPADQKYVVSVNKNELLEALRRVALLVEHKSHRIYVTLKDNTLLLSSEESEIGAAKEEIACRYEGPESVIALNYLYLMDPLRVIAEEEIHMHFTDTGKAMTMYGGERKDYFHIVMPMQID